MQVQKVLSSSLGFDKGSYLEVEHLDGRLQKVAVRRDRKRFNQGTLGNQFYFLNNGSRVYVNEVQQMK
ncbi:hypothetical protein BSK59_13315 [Paenibacillus odorifer]|uniref:hypothetical protein n=1 Tax=Paenibacillus odorifer TaxID=189426 RepID=UPI00096F42CD|nr:hypothetical protein [Paenibacillus odorifer]OME55451.1 hypothetical protein BSK59_13315 [Paenibacillus odorifer]